MSMIIYPGELIQTIKQAYKDGADAVELEMITKENFDKRIEKYIE